MAEGHDKEGIAGQCFRAARVGAGLGLRHMAERFGITHVALGMFERGLITPPKYQLRAYFRVLGEEAASRSSGVDAKERPSG